MRRPELTNVEDLLKIVEENYYASQRGEEQGYLLVLSILHVAREVQLTREALLEIFSHVDFTTTDENGEKIKRSPEDAQTDNNGLMSEMLGGLESGDDDWLESL
jgi:hypothetical protein